MLARWRLEEVDGGGNGWRRTVAIGTTTGFWGISGWRRMTMVGLFDLESQSPDMERFHYRYIPFSGGPRKCVGDQFAMMEAIVALSIFLQKMEFELVPDQKINMTTGATIHTTSVIFSH
ncbi:carotene epsilon-monooxygenase, chloroplastic [Tanacetum coccineum]